MAEPQRDPPTDTVQHGDNHREIPEFHGGQSAEEILDWFSTVEEALELKQVASELHVPMIAMRFRGRAVAWWTQLKTSRARLGKPRITSWDKLKKKMRKTFLPLNYEQDMFQRFNKLQQEEGRPVREYYNEFFMLSKILDLQESEKQTVSRFVGGLRRRIRVKLDVLKPPTVAEAYQQALTLEARFHEDYKNQMKDKIPLMVMLGGFCVAVCVLMFLERETDRDQELRQLREFRLKFKSK